MEERGKHFRNMDRARALMCYDGMNFQGMMPTDLDMVIEIGNSTLIVGELKYGNAEVPIGQRLVIERICTNWAKEGRHALGIIAHHQEKGDVLVKDAKVTMYWDTERSKWVKPERDYTVKSIIDAYILKFPAKSTFKGKGGAK